MSRRLTSRKLRPLLVVVAVLALGGVAVGGAAAQLMGLSSNEQRLRSQVQNSAGEPRSGHDPAVQRQTSLAAAAAGRHGNGTRNVRPARGVKGRSVRRPSQLADPKTTGVLSSGCALGYGQAGSQCVAARRPGGARMTCDYLIRQFPAGIAVTGRDVLKLDTNRDGLACGYGDAGVAGSSRSARSR